MPVRVDAGYRAYAKRLRGEVQRQLREILPEKRTRNADTARVLAHEGERLLAAIPKHASVIALDARGRTVTTGQLAVALGNWMRTGRDAAVLIGGPEGLTPACLERSEQHIPLSALTFPHPLVRVIIAEPLYCACGVLRNHPYHRAG